MQELVDKLKTEAGLTDEQAKKAIEKSIWEFLIKIVEICLFLVKPQCFADSLAICPAYRRFINYRTGLQ